MCNTQADAIPEPSSADRSGRRRALWEIEESYHCSVIGTCLGLIETRKMLIKAGLQVPPDSPDFDVHTNAVRLAESTETHPWTTPGQMAN